MQRRIIITPPTILVARERISIVLYIHDLVMSFIEISLTAAIVVVVVVEVYS